MNSKQAYDLTNKLEGVSVKNHFGSDGFSANKRMFLTLWPEKNLVNLRLSPEDQQKFLSQDGDAFSPIENAWGRQGWTRIHLDCIEKSDFQLALEAAFEFSKQAVKKSKTKSKTKSKSKSKTK